MENTNSEKLVEQIELSEDAKLIIASMDTNIEEEGLIKSQVEQTTKNMVTKVIQMILITLKVPQMQ